MAGVLAETISPAGLASNDLLERDATTMGFAMKLVMTACRKRKTVFSLVYLQCVVWPMTCHIVL